MITEELYSPIFNTSAATSLDDMIQRLRDRLTLNFGVYRRDTLDLSKEQLFQSASEIAAVNEIYNHLMDRHDFTEAEADFLLRFQNPLGVLTDGRESQLYDVRDTVGWIMGDKERIFQKGGYEIVIDEPNSPLDMQTRSVTKKRGLNYKEAIMNYFEQELRRLANACDGIINPTFAGRACYGNLGGDNRIKLEFVTQGTHEQYEAVKATVLNRVDGEVDSLLFRFGDVWGKKHPHGSAHGTAHIWTRQSKSEWYAYYPTDTDMKKLGAVVSAYLAVFTDRSLIPEKTKGRTGGEQSVIKTIRESKQDPPPRKGSKAQKKSELDL